MFSVAIDGPSGAGKSTLARKIAAELGFLYVDTGALYRAIGLAALRAGASTKTESEVRPLLAELMVSLRFVKGEQRVFLASEDVTDSIRTEQVSMAASDVSAHGSVRDFLLDTQRRLAQENNVIMDGRDIGTVVLPNAELKIFLTATVDDRARRRYNQLLEKGEPADFEAVKKDIETRDYNDSHRAVAPLKKANDAQEMDTTGESLPQSHARMLLMITGARAKVAGETKTRPGR